MSDPMAHFEAEELPADLLERSRERSWKLAELHQAWAARQAALGVPFDPDAHPEGSDYNLHSFDLDASGEEQDDFAAAAAEILAA